jgi:ABC-type microcin C transport system duplicated ATPase subunit YejF
MSIQLFDPVFEVELVKQQEERRLESLTGKKVGYIFNQHVSALAFWRSLEAQIESKLKPAAVHRLYKTNTWASAPKAEVEELIRQTDYALIGVGA